MATLGKIYCTSICVALWLAVLLLLQPPCESRYLPTRSHSDDLDKLRELMLQILESSDEDVQRPPNEANGNTMVQRSSWLNKLSPRDAAAAAVAEGQRKYSGASYGPRGVYEGPRYY